MTHWSDSSEHACPKRLQGAWKFFPGFFLEASQQETPREVTEYECGFRKKISVRLLKYIYVVSSRFEHTACLAVARVAF